MGIEALEIGKADRPLRVRHEGAVVSLPVPSTMTYQEIIGALLTSGRSLITASTVAIWKHELLLERWLAHHELGTMSDIGRLSQLVEQYEPHLTYDLQAHLGVDLAELWRTRRWRRLLMLIDRLPRWTYYSEAMMNDPEHAKRIAEAQARVNAPADGGPKGPPLSNWTPEVEALTRLIDVTKAVSHTIIAVNSQKKAPEPPAPEPRPRTEMQRALARAERERARAVHEEIVNRFLHPSKRRPSAESTG